ncbi:hypothetical protein [Tabrizicola sp.]|uniref:hypothetical protein n=1 Tax=Tabrizicola sp. TaxID=2005166 RepID=UPI003F38F6F8
MHITHRLFAATLIAMSGASVMVAMTTPGHIDPELLLPAACGAFIAGAISAPLFGHPARQGAVMAAIGAIFATALGAAAAGLGLALVAADPVFFLIAPVMVGASILAMPHVLLVWVGTMAGAHLVMLFLRSIPDWVD